MIIAINRIHYACKSWNSFNAERLTLFKTVAKIFFAAILKILGLSLDFSNLSLRVIPKETPTLEKNDNL